MSILTPGEIRPFLQMNTQAPSVADETLQELIDAAEATIATHPEHGVGPLEPTIVTERLDATGGLLLLGTPPVISVTSLERDGVAVDVDAVRVRDDLLAPASSTGTPLDGCYDVTYVAGWETVPANVRLAIREMVRHLFSPQRGPGQVLGPGQSPAPAGPTGARALPPRVVDLLAGSGQVVGFA